MLNNNCKYFQLASLRFMLTTIKQQLYSEYKWFHSNTINYINMTPSRSGNSRKNDICTSVILMTVDWILNTRAHVNSCKFCIHLSVIFTISVINNKSKQAFPSGSVQLVAPGPPSLPGTAAFPDNHFLFISHKVERSFCLFMRVVSKTKLACHYCRN